MMDLEPLREAARLMRERASAATPGSWKATDNSSIEAPSGFRGRVVASVGAYESGWPSAADAQHIASWHPAVALAVADWLDTGANQYACVDREPMFRVARAYLGPGRDCRRVGAGRPPHRPGDPRLSPAPHRGCGPQCAQ